MPELPEVETVRRGLERAMVGRRIAKVNLKRSDLRFPLPVNFAAKLRGREVHSIDRRGKYLTAYLSGGMCLIMHLGMSGRFTIASPSASGIAQRSGGGVHDHVTFTLDDHTLVVFTDPRRFGMMDLVAGEKLVSHKLFKNLGVEPLSGELDAAYLAAAFEGKKAPLKSALLDQRLIAGLGNIYASEALFRSGLSPQRRAGSLVRRKAPHPKLDNLVAAIRAVLGDALAAGGSTLRDYAQADGTSGTYQQRFSVYGRMDDPCRKPGCTGKIRRLVQAGRSTFYCPVCQR